jgi:hypothetical protein
LELYSKNKIVIDATILTVWLTLIPLWYFTDRIESLLLFLFLLAFRLEYFWKAFKNIIEKPFGTVDNFFKTAFIFLFSVPAIGIVAWQIYTYLKDGEWQSVSLITCLQYFNNTWATTPNDWQGLWNVLNMIPLSIMLLVIAATILFEHD